MTDAPLLTTERLELWKPVYADVERYCDITTHPETAKYLGVPESRVYQYNRFHENAGSWYLHGYGRFTLRYRGESRIVGILGVFHSNRGLGADFDMMPEGGWIIAHDQAGRGLASEGMHAALAWFDANFGPRRIVCGLSPENLASKRVAEKLGFTPLRELTMSDGSQALAFERLPT